MLIVISPSKTMLYKNSEYLENKPLIYPKKHKKVLAQLRKLSKSEIGRVYNIKDDLLSKTYSNIKDYSKNESYQAFPSFTGLVFFNLDRDNYKQAEYDYIAKNLRILDAFYGVLEPGTLVKPYRLDMKTKIGINLYKHWNIDSYFKDDIIINLASTEFSNMITKPMININFLQSKNGNYINQATYSKQARGLFLDYLIKNKIEDRKLMQEFNLDNYSYNRELSDISNITFTR